MCGCEHVGIDVCRCERIQILLVSIQLFSSSMCVQEEKKNELSNKSKQYPTNNKRFSSKVPRADWVSILNLKTRLSHVNFFIYRIIKGSLVGRYLSKVSTFFRFVRKAKFNDTIFSILNVLCSIDVDVHHQNHILQKNIKQFYMYTCLRVVLILYGITKRLTKLCLRTYSISSKPPFWFCLVIYSIPTHSSR